MVGNKFFFLSKTLSQEPEMAFIVTDEIRKEYELQMFAYGNTRHYRHNACKSRHSQRMAAHYCCEQIIY